MTEDEQEIMALCNQLSTAHRNKDAEIFMSCYSPRAVVYGLAPPLQSELDCGDLVGWLETWDGPILLDAANHDLVVGDGLVWSMALNRMRGTKRDGTVEDLWFRTTTCFREGDSGWRTVHDHSSTPFYMDGSLRAAIDLKPDDVDQSSTSAERPEPAT